MKRNILFEYLKRHLVGFVLLLVFSGVFSLVFFLYDVPRFPVRYAGLLCLFIGLVIVGTDFMRFYRRHKQLLEFQKRICIDIEKLPVVNGLIENDYIQLVKVIDSDRKKRLADYAVWRGNLTDYYTLWVHQIKTPIAAMRLLLQSEDNENNRELEAELFKIEQYVEMVLQFLRVDNEHTDYVIGRQNLEKIVRSSVRKYAKLFIIKNISVDVGNISAEVLSDEKWLSFVIEQIISNALKYTEKGSISIFLENEETLVIEDSGIGIAKEDLPRVFEKGFTGYNGRTDKKSTGIGLYLCKKIMDKLGHKIEISSEVGKGTKVKLIFEKKEMVFE